MKRLTRKRPVLQFRVSQSLYDAISRAARKNDRTISEEAALRLEAYGEAHCPYCGGDERKCDFDFRTDRCSQMGPAQKRAG